MLYTINIIKRMLNFVLHVSYNSIQDSRVRCNLDGVMKRRWRESKHNIRFLSQSVLKLMLPCLIIMSL